MEFPIRLFAVTLTQKIWMLITIPFVVAIASYLIVTRPFRRDLLLAEASRDAKDDVVVLQSAIDKGLIDEKTHAADLAALVESIAQAERVVGVAVFGINGQPIAESSGVRGNPHLRELALRAIQKHGEIRELRGNPTNLEHAFILERAGPVAVAVVIRDIGYVDKLVGTWTRSLIFIGVGFAFVMLLVSGVLVRRIVGDPLHVMVDAVENVAAGKLDASVPDTRRDELGRLARSFNAMTESLRTARAAVEDAAQRRAELEARMRRLQTLAAAGEVAASLAHEIGSPLNVILGRTRMMAGRADTADNTKRDLEIVAAQTERITRVVRKLLDISRPSKGRIDEVNLREVVEETLAFIAPECKKRNIVMTSVVEPGTPELVLGDRDQLVQIIFNLAHNALQAQPKGGRIDVRLHRSEQALSGVATIAIDVADAGPGIAPEVRGRLFDPFVTTKRGEGGTGLGLAIVDGMVRELGGRVTVDDGPSGGACFRVEIPALVQRSSTT